MTTRLPVLQNLNLQELLVERQIMEKGYLSWEDFIQWQEHKPWLIAAVANDIGLTHRETSNIVKDGTRFGYFEVKTALLDYEIKMLRGEALCT
jgi:hypothetical protein